MTYMYRIDGILMKTCSNKYIENKPKRQLDNVIGTRGTLSCHCDILLVTPVMIKLSSERYFGLSHMGMGSDMGKL